MPNQYTKGSVTTTTSGFAGSTTTLAYNPEALPIHSLLGVISDRLDTLDNELDTLRARLRCVSYCPPEVAGPTPTEVFMGDGEFTEALKGVARRLLALIDATHAQTASLEL